MSKVVRDLSTELWHFFIANARASAFGAFLLAMFLLTEVVSIPFIARYDFLFLAALGFQVCAILLRYEEPREVLVIFIFHILATIMELFKTHPAIGSWIYPDAPSAVFVLATVPLFTGFLYSAIGSYISRAFQYLHLSYEKFPAYVHIWILSVLIYINFFTHHFILDLRYVLFAHIVVIFFKTEVHFQVYRTQRRMPFLLASFLTAVCVWIAENVGTYSHVWLYPTQIQEWHIVSVHKIGSWFLLLVLSFALVSIMYRDKLHGRSKQAG